MNGREWNRKLPALRSIFRFFLLLRTFFYPDHWWSWYFKLLFELYILWKLTLTSCETCVNMNEYIHQCGKIFLYIYVSFKFICFVSKLVSLKKLYKLWLQLKTFEKNFVLELNIFRIEMTTFIAFFLLQFACHKNTGCFKR